jgi:peptidoglycan hydrolase FlgJ
MQISNVANSHSYPVAATAARKQTIDKSSDLYKACVDFEALFIKQMLDSMRKTINKEDGLFGTSTGQKYYEDMQYDQYSQSIASTGQFGIADTIYKQVINQVSSKS